MEIVRLKLTDLEQNSGQIAGLPINPRQWKKGDVERLAKSLKETPELFEARPIIVIPNGEGNKYVILGGNMRFEASKLNKAKDVPAVILPADMPVEKLKEIVIKDNGSFGEWDVDMLANMWDDLPLPDWGVNVAIDVEDEVAKAMEDEEKMARVPFTEVLGEEHNFVVLFFDNEVDWLQAQTLLGLEPVKALPTKKGVDNSDSFKRVGVGRVLNGAKAIQKILGQ